MNVHLLDKTRKISKLLHKLNTDRLVFNDICEVLSDILNSHVGVISKNGKILGQNNKSDISIIDEFACYTNKDKIDSVLNDRFLNILSTKENINLLTLGFESEGVEKYKAIVSPIDIAGKRLGSLIAYKTEVEYTIDDIIVIEYASTVIGLELMRSINEVNERESRKLQVVSSAINTLSNSERRAIIHIFDELDSPEGVLVASKIADRVGITRSVIVNALRKFESAGVIETKSSGMKGTYIKIINDVVIDELDRIKEETKEEDK